MATTKKPTGAPRRAAPRRPTAKGAARPKATARPKAPARAAKRGLAASPAPRSSFPRKRESRAAPRTPAGLAGKAKTRRPPRGKAEARPAAAEAPAFRTIGELATVIRSKNAKAFGLTLDMLFPDRATYERVKRSRVINKRTIARLYGITDNEVLSVIEFDPGNAIKATIRRPIPCGGFGDADVYGCQQHAPLFDIRIPWGD